MYQLIFMNYKMHGPWGNGDIATIQIKSYLTENICLQHPYIVCLTSYEENKREKVNALNAGMDDFCNKPIYKASMYRILVASKLIEA